MMNSTDKLTTDSERLVYIKKNLIVISSVVLRNITISFGLEKERGNGRQRFLYKKVIINFIFYILSPIHTCKYLKK